VKARIPWILILAALMIFSSCSLVEDVAENGQDWPEGAIISYPDYSNPGADMCYE
jgi:hypothetical protein